MQGLWCVAAAATARRRRACSGRTPAPPPPQPPPPLCMRLLLLGFPQPIHIGATLRACLLLRIPPSFELTSGQEWRASQEQQRQCDAKGPHWSF